MAEKGEGWLLVHPMSSELGGRAAFSRDRYIPAAEQSADREGDDNVEQILIKMQRAPEMGKIAIFDLDLSRSNW